ncbi:glycosyltransferase family 4 protein [Sphingomonas psychrolutea]|uniref:Hexosyltransferase n=1 Tax=Sphingomonas psychrolutea TaxID=1259676 RepID=A0ABQ1G284_9SPHN|nr:glycosyltransferase family 4 protein [Sphingomonas psychrolutea]GGA34130.1 hexosyltransferase [Sphingomonas psychrolutea]
MAPRVAILFDNFGPYHIARMLGAAAPLDVVAIEATPRGTEYGWDKPVVPAPLHYLPLAGAGTLREIVAELDSKLTPLAPAAIALPGWSSRAAFAALIWARQRKVPAILMSETNGWDFARKPIAEWVKRRIVAHYSAGLVTSDSQARYLVDLGLNADAIFRGYNAVDNAYFASTSANATMPEGLPETPHGRYFLTSNRFIEKKNLARLLDAYAAFRRGRSDDPADWPLVLLGDGALRAALETQRKALRLERHVLMPGFRQIDELPRFYGTAGAFVHASTTEQWGLVVNEAMASGLPVAISNRCGCAEVLVEDGVTGLLFDPFDTAAITRVLTRLTATDESAAFAAHGRARVDAWGPARFGSGMAEAVRAAVAAPAGPNGMDRAMLNLVARRR